MTKNLQQYFEKKPRLNTKMQYGGFSTINVMTYLAVPFTAITWLVVMLHYLAFYTLRYKKKSYVS